MPTLCVPGPDSSEVIYPLQGKRVTVGRRADNTVQIMDPSVSGRHAELLQVGDHYVLHDLESTNLCFVDGVQIIDYHLQAPCTLSFGKVVCRYDPLAKAPVIEDSVVDRQLRRDVAFLRGENQDLRDKITQLQRQIDILSSAPLVTGKAGNGGSADSALAEVKRVREERDAALYQNSGLKMEVERLKGDLDALSQQRESTMQAMETPSKMMPLVPDATREGKQPAGDDQKGSTQRIIFPVPAVRQ